MMSLCVSLCLSVYVGTGGGNQGGYPLSFLRTLGLKLSFRCCRCGSDSELNRAAELAARTTQFNTAAPQPQEQALALLERLLASGGEVRTRTFQSLPQFSSLCCLVLTDTKERRKAGTLSAPNASPGLELNRTVCVHRSGQCPVRTDLVITGSSVRHIFAHFFIQN